MPLVKMMQRQDRELGRGKIRVKLPEVVVDVPEPREVGPEVAKLVERKLRARLGAVPGRWTGFARWLAQNLRVNGNAVEWPHSDAVERMGAMDIDPQWLDEAIKEAIKDSIR